jgi:uncharacterized protein
MFLYDSIEPEMKTDLVEFRFGKKGAGPRVLITAGMDGDEYAGIRAAYELAGRLRSEKVHGEVIIIPVVNIPGFFSGMSKNPDDGKYPKHIYPGNPKGTSTEMLIHRIRTDYVCGSDLWIDLHSGSLSEQLTPCILSYDTGNPAVNAVTRQLLSGVHADRVVFEKMGAWKKCDLIARDGVSYVMFESGWGGSAAASDYGRHVTWSLDALGSTGVLDRRLQKVQIVRVFTSIREQTAPGNLLWWPLVRAGDTVTRGQIAGSLMRLTRAGNHEVKCVSDGTILWIQRTPQAARGSTLFAIAVGKNEIDLTK